MIDMNKNYEYCQNNLGYFNKCGNHDFIEFHVLL